MSSGISFSSVRKSFRRHDGGELPVLDGFSLEVKAGELIALVGPSGIGKSTLLHMLAGLDQPSGGRVSFTGNPTPRIGMVFQQPRLLSWMSVERNVSVAAEAANVSPDYGREMLAIVGLGEHRGAYPATLSGGQRQRVSIARAFAIRPDLILLDEPFSALDELTARHLRQVLRRVWSATAPTGVLITHNILEAAFLADRIIVLGGRPARVIEDIPVSVPHPRSPDDIALFEINRRVLALLEREAPGFSNGH